MSIDEAIQRESKIAKENQKIVDTQIVFDNVSISELYCDDTEVIEEHLSNYKKCAEYHEQLAEWLEELKSYRASVFSGDMTQKMLKEEYNKAIDDLLEDANEMAIEVDVDTYTMKAIGIGLLENIAEQLKAGGGEYKGGWIPCSERLPEDGGYYLVTYHEWSDGNFLPKYDDTYVRRMHYQKSERFTGWNYPRCVDDRAENDTNKEVIAWQPLPEVYKN